MANSTSDRVFVDTNILVYSLDASEPEKQELARKRLEQEAARSEMVISTQVLQELYSALTRGRQPIRTSADAETAVRSTARLTTVAIDASLVFAGISRSRRDRIEFWDALIVEAALLGGCGRLLSEDFQDGRSFDGVRVENPFSEAPPASKDSSRR